MQPDPWDKTLKTLFRDRGPWIYAVISRIVPDPNQAEDLVVEVFWQAVRSTRVQALGPQGVSVWLSVRARHLAIDCLRSNRPERGHPPEFRSEYLQAASDLSRISSALNNLPAHEREVFELAYFEGLSHSEIAEITGRSLGTVKTWVRASRLRIARLAESDQMQSDPSTANTVPSLLELASTV